MKYFLCLALVGFAWSATADDAHAKKHRSKSASSSSNSSRHHHSGRREFEPNVRYLDHAVTSLAGRSASRTERFWAYVRMSGH